MGSWEGSGQRSEDELCPDFCCLWLWWDRAAFLVILGSRWLPGTSQSQGCLPCPAAPLLQLPDEFQQVHLQHQLLGYRGEARVTPGPLSPRPKGARQ